jgi:SAM-dependent methyltransferase
LLYGAEEVYAFDYAYETSCVAQKNLALFPQATVLQKSIYDFKKIAYFDLVFSIGVVHHLEKPREAVVNLWQSVKKGGKLLVWVYGYEGNEFIVRSVNLLRIATSRLPLSLVHVMATFFTVPLHIGVKMGMFRSHPYFRQLADFRFWHTKSIVFDQLLPRIAHYWTRDQAIALFEGLPYASISASRVNNNSWTIIAEK